MREDIQSFAALYAYIKALPENDTFLNHRESNQWKTFSKTEFITAVRYLTLAFDAEGWRGKQIALVISPSVYWLMIDYALMLSGAVSVPLFTNISTKNLRFQINDADLHTAFTQTADQERIILEADSSVSHLIHSLKTVKRSTRYHLQNSTKYSLESLRMIWSQSSTLRALQVYPKA